MKESFLFAFLHRMKYIQRWGLMRNTEIENIKEHSLDVAFIAHNLACISNHYYGGHIDANEVAVKAMFHDASEVFTGDMPTPIKYFNATLRQLYGDIEKAAQHKLLETLPEPLQSDYEPLICEDETSVTSRFVKAADILAAYMKCVREVHAGNDEFQEAHDSILAKLQALDMPEVDLFLQLYSKPLSYSLDKLHYYHIDSSKAKEDT